MIGCILLRIEIFIERQWLGGRLEAFELLVGVQGSYGEGRRLSPMLIQQVSIAKNLCTIISPLGPEPFHPDHRCH